MTSEVDRISPSAPKPPLRSNRDDANACAAQHARAVHQRRNHALLAARRISLGSERALARAKCLRNDWASSDHLPPVSHASTTSRARPCSPVNSGHVRSFVRRAWSRAAPSRSAHCLLGAPSARTVLTIVVSTASCAPWNRGKPSATTSSRL